MAYEIHYHYYEKAESGVGYNSEASKVKKKVIGEVTEDVPLETVANAILKEMARRDILVHDVEVYELVKKKISFKENKDGIVLKNRSFSLDIGVKDTTKDNVSYNHPHPHESMKSSSVDINDEHEWIDDVPAVDLRAQKPQRPQRPNPTGRPLLPHEIMEQPHQRLRRETPKKRVVFMPSTPQGSDNPEDYKIPGKFTLDREYTVISEKYRPSGIGLQYTLEDDRGEKVVVSDMHFIPAEVNLFADKELGFTQSVSKKADARLSFENDLVEDEGSNIALR